jgi:hypothetical protein
MFSLYRFLQKKCTKYYNNVKKTHILIYIHDDIESSMTT